MMEKMKSVCALGRNSHRARLSPRPMPTMPPVPERFEALIELVSVSENVWVLCEEGGDPGESVGLGDGQRPGGDRPHVRAWRAHNEWVSPRP